MSGSGSRNLSALFSSSSEEWPTPANLYATLNKEFEFELDPCASPTNAKCSRFFTAADDGLTKTWTGSVFMNPPYGKRIGEWVRKAFMESRSDGTTVVCLIPARTDTAYWHQFVMRAHEIRFIRGRLHFTSEVHEQRRRVDTSAGHNAPFPSVVVVFDGGSRPTVCQIERDGRPVVLSEQLAVFP